MNRISLLLGLVDRGAVAPPDVPQHRRLPFESGLDAILVDAATGGDAPEVQALELALAQVAILSAYAAQDDVLPVALGAAFSGDEAVLAHLQAIKPHLLARRAELAGQSEWIVAIDRRASSGSEPQPEGGGYLRRKLAEKRAQRDADTARDDFVRAVIGAFGPCEVRLAGPSARSRMSLAVVAAMVHRAAVQPVRTRLEDLAAEGERLGLSLRLIGPCAPFSFIAAGGHHG